MSARIYAFRDHCSNTQFKRSSQSWMCICVFTAVLHKSAVQVFCCIESITESNPLLSEYCAHVRALIHILAHGLGDVSCLTLG